MRVRSIFLFTSFVYLVAFGFFSFKYIPLIKSFLLVLIPLFLVSVLLTSLDLEKGILFFVFAFPLVNNIPFFFGIDDRIPHAPTSLVLFLAFFLGWLIHKAFHASKPQAYPLMIKLVILLSLILCVSGLITFFRYLNFFPFLSNQIRELVVNVNGVRAGGALMSDIFSLLNYLTGFVFFFIFIQEARSRLFIKKILFALSLSVFLSLSFAFVQSYVSPVLGNKPYWINLNRINSTFVDPNSFGAFLSAFFPVLLGLAFFLKKWLKLYPLALAIFTLFVFPFVGSRSGMLGLGVSSLLFLIIVSLHIDIPLKKKLFAWISLIFILALLLFSFSYFSKHTNLYKRIGWSVERLAHDEAINKIFTGRMDFWPAALNMIRDYPLTGVGPGAFIIELPNYLKEQGLPFQQTDSAENYFFQIGSELGFIGLILILWVFVEIIKQIRKSWRGLSAASRDKYILVGLVSGLIALMLNFLFHSYIGSFEVKYFFWLLVGAIFVYAKDIEPQQKHSGFSQRFKMAALLIPIFFGGIHLWNSTHSLLIDARTEKFGWEQNFGLYEQEKDARGAFFRWAQESAGIVVKKEGPVLVMQMVVSHPKVEKIPVIVKIFSADKYFNKRKLIKEISFQRKQWIDAKIPLTEHTGDNIYLVFETSRTWQPQAYSGAPDLRRLAVGLGQCWFEYPVEGPANMIKERHQISHQNWEGQFKDKLWANGTSQNQFKIERSGALLCLHIRGRKAFGLGPHIIVRLDGRIIGRTVLTSEDWTSLVFAPDVTSGEHTLSVEFTNDLHSPQFKQDRNVFLGDLEILYLSEN